MRRQKLARLASLTGPELLQELKIRYVKTIEEVLEYAFPRRVLRAVPGDDGEVGRDPAVGDGNASVRGGRDCAPHALGRHLQ